MNMKNNVNWFCNSNNFGMATFLSSVTYMQFTSSDNTTSFNTDLFMNDMF